MTIPSLKPETVTNLKVDIQQLPHGKDLPLPSYATDQSAGLDLYAAITEDITLQPGDIKLVPSGIAIALPQGYEAQVRSRSGLSLKNGVIVLNAPGTIDADYRGEIMGIMTNLGKEPFIITRGLRFAQLVIAQHERVDWNQVTGLEVTIRGTGGFGSTGLKG
ncbi:dUTP diphosphatase [Candidatus Odyssella thessalonicensis]|uniref:dUTP diphosphatase n=1 Tax=Candidatus Odyssella thessalonicensis TaxID=84647 RepID=UPI000225AC59|nr:dUTP diphosphatase [Candidatus Odyssella thessalonicensis]